MGLLNRVMNTFRGHASNSNSELTPSGDHFRGRRKIVAGAITGFLGINFLMFVRFFFPRAVFEPSTVFVVGYPSDFAVGVDSRFLQTARIWIVRDSAGVFAIFARCTHLGCTPDWKPSDDKFKCPCHGSGFDSEGINFEGPAPRPMDRAHIELLPTGQIQVDTSRLYQAPEFGEAGSILHDV